MRRTLHACTRRMLLLALGLLLAAAAPSSASPTQQQQQRAELCSDEARWGELFAGVDDDLRHWQQAGISQELMYSAREGLTSKRSRLAVRGVAMLFQGGRPFLLSSVGAHFRHPGRTLVFVNAISAVRRLAAILKILGLPAEALHAQQQQRQRLKAVDRFKSSPQAILIASDVAARGLDIKGVRCVIHYQLPASADTYIHRSGRTARAGADGLSIALVTPKEASRWMALTKAMGRDEQLPSFPVDRTVMPQVHQRMKLAIKVDDILRSDRKSKAETTWSRSNAEALGIDLASGDLDDLLEEEQGTSNKVPNSSARALQAQLAQLLATPLAPKMSTRFFTGGAAAYVAHGSGLHATTSDAEAHTAVPAATLNMAVSLATQLQQSKKAIKAQQEARKQKGQSQPATDTGGQAAAPKKKAKKKPAVKRASPAALAREILKKRELKKKQKRGVFVAPTAVGRDALGSDALQALKNKLAQ